MIKQFHTILSDIAELFNIQTRPLTGKWSDIYNRRRKNRGKKDAVKFMKELNTVAERYALHQPIKPLPWTKSDKDNFPIILRAFKKPLRSSRDLEVVFTLSVMRTVELLRLPISKDISTVTNRSTADSDTLSNIINFIPGWVRKFNLPTLPEIKYHLTIKNGPNGHALLKSDSDISAVITSPKLFGAIRVVEEKLLDKHQMKVLWPEDYPSVRSSLHSKLTQFPEKAGKTRTIAVVDYYSQRCLKPLHEGIMRLLKRMVSDGTYSHANVGTFAKEATKNKSFVACFDLSAATDRFPREIQKLLLKELIKDNDLAASWWTLLAERTFKVAWSNEYVTYNCGQPMGAYSSWPLFALAHHLLVEYSAYQAGTKLIKDKYRLIGDDVIITDQRTATVYKELCSKLGLEINLDKTVVSHTDSPKSGAEVAKQLFLNGRCLTPLTPGFIRDIKKPYMFNACMRVLMDRYSIQTLITPSVVIKKLFPNKNSFKKTWLLASDPYDGIIKPEDSGYSDYSPWANKDIGLADEIKALAYLPSLQAQAKKLSDAIQIQQDELLSDNPSGTPTDRCTSRALPFVLESINELIIETKAKLFPTNMPTIQEILSSFTYMPDPMTPFQERKDLKYKRLSSFKEACFIDMPEVLDNEPTNEDEFESWTWVEEDDDFADLPTLDSW